MDVIAIDGPSGSGKSTIARIVAERLDMPYLDTGAMYRAIGLMARQRNVAFTDAAGLTALAAETKLQMLDERVDGKLKPRVIANGIDVTDEIRTPESSHASSAIAVHPTVRERLVKRQRTWVTERGGGVVEGRDIGSVVFPDAVLKIFLTASEAERAKRRNEEVSSRDERDSQRKASPLVATPDSVLIDTSGREIEDVVVEVLSELRKRYDGELPRLASN